MEETAGTVVASALQELTVLASEQQIPASEMMTGIKYLNRMMSAYSTMGIKLGYSLVNSPTDAITVPAGAIEGMVSNLAMRLATTYDIAITIDLANKAKEGLVAMRKEGQTVAQQKFSGSLPVGSGNEGAGGQFDSQTFFAGECEDGDFDSGSNYNPDTNGC